MIVPWQVGMYPHHGGDNQVWRLEEGGVISTQLDPALVLVVGEGGAVVLGQRAGAGQSWGAGQGGLLSWGDTGLVLTQQCGGGVGAAPPREECPHQSWDLVPAADMDTAATPATSCHLRYPLPGDVSPHVSTCSVAACRLAGHVSGLGAALLGHRLGLHPRHLLLRGGLGPGRILGHPGGHGGQEGRLLN